MDGVALALTLHALELDALNVAETRNERLQPVAAYTVSLHTKCIYTVYARAQYVAVRLSESMIGTE